MGHDVSQDGQSIRAVVDISAVFLIDERDRVCGPQGAVLIRVKVVPSD